MTRNNLFRFSFSVILWSCTTCASMAQLMFNLRLGGMVFQKETWCAIPEDRALLDPEYHVDFNIGLEAEIPLSERFFLETGLRYHNLLVRQWTYEKYKGKDNDATNCLELPLRFAYNQRLNDVIAIRAGIGPYAQFNLADFPSEKPWQVGLEPNVAIYFKNFNIGALYHIPLYKGYVNKIKPHIEVTLGIRFSTGAMSNIGTAMGIAAEAMGNAALSTQRQIGFSNNPESQSQTSATQSNTYVKQDGNKYNVPEQQNYNTDKKTCEVCDGRLSKHFTGLTGATRSEVESWQQQIRSLRAKWQKKGKSLPNYANENKSTTGCPESFHKH